MKKSKPISLGTLAVVGLLLLLPVASCTYSRGTIQEDVLITVTDKERVNGQDSSTYLVFTDAETYRVGDSIWHGSFNASDRYGKLREGRQYKADVYGWRVPFLSMYRNIIRIEEVAE